MIRFTIERDHLKTKTPFSSTTHASWSLWNHSDYHQYITRHATLLDQAS
jgi:hypothetical protein